MIKQTAILFLLLLFFIRYTYSQQLLAPCGTPPPDLSSEKARQRSLIINNNLYNRTGGKPYHIPMQFHIYGNDDGQGYYSIESLITLMCEINQRYEPVGFRFYLNDLPIYINSSKYYDHDKNQQEGWQMVNESFVNDVVNIYVVNTTNGACGYAWYPGSGPQQGGVVIQKDCAGTGATTLAHELGHFFSIPHPFSGWEGTTPPDYPWNVEYVNGSNCAFGGDQICDTRADFISNRWYCPYTGTFTDPNGDVYNPDEALFMSYSLDNCQSYFSPMQITQMNYAYNNERPELKGQPNPDTSLLNVPLLFEPNNGDTLHPSDLVFRWNSVSGADYYIITHWKGTAIMKKSYITSDTFFVSPANFNYQKWTWKWKVKAISKGQVCGEYSNYSTFVTDTTTGTITDIDEIPYNTLLNHFSIQIYPNPSINGNRDLSFLINSPFNGNVSISIFSVEGKLLKYDKYFCTTGENYFPVNINSYSKGAYLIQTKAGKLTFNNKIMVY